MVAAWGSYRGVSEMVSVLAIFINQVRLRIQDLKILGKQIQHLLAYSNLITLKKPSFDL